MNMLASLRSEASRDKKLIGFVIEQFALLKAYPSAKPALIAWRPRNYLMQLKAFYLYEKLILNRLHYVKVDGAHDSFYMFHPSIINKMLEVIDENNTDALRLSKILLTSKELGNEL